MSAPLSPSEPVRPTGPDQVDQAFELILAQQADPLTACAYVGTTREGLLAELVDLDVPWQESLRVGLDEGQVVAAVLVEYDDETGRSWIHGPWAADDRAWARWADALVQAAVAQTPEGVADHEICASPVNGRMAQLADSLRWPAGEVNVAYVARSDEGWPPPASGARTATDADLPALSLLHDEAFPGTYATARQLLADPDRTTVVLDQGGSVLGYASAEVHADGEGYLDFIALVPAARGRGLAGGLLAHIGREVLGQASSASLNLTVSRTNVPAIALYESLGFVRDAELVGYRSRPRTR